MGANPGQPIAGLPVALTALLGRARELGADVLEAPAADGHGMDPESVLRLLRSLGGRVERVVVVGCQPASVQEQMGLSEPVEGALDEI